MTASPYARPPGEIVVDGYTLLSKIGEGGMGVVHLAQRPDGPRVALKVLRPHVVGGDEGRARLAREVASLSRVRSRRVAEIVDADPWGEIAYVATRYVPGLCLHDVVADDGPLAGGELRRFAAGLAEAIAAVHAVGVLHRDIKPSNVLLEGRDPVLIDFGLARLAEEDQRLTQTGWLLGTPGYLAPEILLGDDPSTAADVHSFAATVAFAGLGRSPFGKGPAMAVMDRVRRGEHDLSGLPAPARRLLEPALHPDPLVRPTLAELSAELDAPSPPRPAPTPEVDVGEPELTLPYATVARHDAAADTDVHPARASADTRAETIGETRDFRDEAFHDDLGDEGHDGYPDDERGPSREPYRTPPPIDPRLRPDLYDERYAHPSQHPLPALPPEPRPTAVQRARVSTVVVLAGLAVAASTAAFPWPTLTLLLLGTWLARGVSAASSGVRERRLVRGRRWYDVPRASALLPVHLVTTVPVTVLLLLWAAGFAGCAAVAAWAFGATSATVLGLTGLVAAVCLWTGPGGGRVRDPVRRMLLPVARDTGSWGLAVLLVAGLGAVAAYLALQQGTSWAPSDQAPWASWGDGLRALRTSWS